MRNIFALLVLLHGNNNEISHNYNGHTKAYSIPNITIIFPLSVSDDLLYL